MSLEGRGAVVTGGGRGIGLAVARRLARERAKVVVCARSLDRVEAAARALRDEGAEVHALGCDVADPSSVEAMADAAREKVGPVDILINNAGIATSAPLAALDLADWERIFAVNVTGTFLVTRAFVPAMCERRFGRVVNVASVASRVGAPYVSAYTASKHAVLGFSRSVASEVAKKGVTINCVCPGYVDTIMTAESVARVRERTGLSAEDALAAILKTVGQARLVTPDEVAFLVASLCAAEAGATTGQAIVIDGGGFLG